MIRMAISPRLAINTFPFNRAPLLVGYRSVTAPEDDSFTHDGFEMHELHESPIFPQEAAGLFVSVNVSVSGTIKKDEYLYTKNIHPLSNGHLIVRGSTRYFRAHRLPDRIPHGNSFSHTTK